MLRKFSFQNRLNSNDNSKANGAESAKSNFSISKGNWTPKVILLVSDRLEKHYETLFAKYVKVALKIVGAEKTMQTLKSKNFYNFIYSKEVIMDFSTPNCV